MKNYGIIEHLEAAVSMARTFLEEKGVLVKEKYPLAMRLTRSLFSHKVEIKRGGKWVPVTNKLSGIRTDGMITTSRTTTPFHVFYDTRCILCKKKLDWSPKTDAGFTAACCGLEHKAAPLLMEISVGKQRDKNFWNKLKSTNSAESVCREGRG